MRKRPSHFSNMMERKELNRIEENKSVGSRTEREHVRPGKVRSTRRNATEPGDMIQPTDTDVLCGRGRTNFFHKGNERFRRIVGENLDEYLKTEHKNDKSKIVYRIADLIREGGTRYLRMDEAGRWYETDDKAAREKIGHALRDATSDKCRAIKTIHLNSNKARAKANKRSHYHRQKSIAESSLSSRTEPLLETIGGKTPVFLGSHYHPPLRFDEHPITRLSTIPDDSSSLYHHLALATGVQVDAVALEASSIEEGLDAVLSQDLYNALVAMEQSESEFSDSTGECLDFLDSVSLNDLDAFLDTK